MNFAVITPTFSGHFPFVKEYLDSLEKYLLDKDQIDIVFTVEATELEEFKKITVNYPNLNIYVHTFDEILKKFNVELTPQELLKKYSKFSFQTLKKFYTLLNYPAQYSLILDSESMLVRPTNLSDVFRGFIDNPFITVSDMSRRDVVSDFTATVVSNRNCLLNTDCNKWFLENFVWFYDRKILDDMVKTIGTPIEWIRKLHKLDPKRNNDSGLFEIDLYHAFIYENISKYGYEIKDADKLLEGTLTKDEYSTYISRHLDAFKGNTGMLEHTMLLLSDKTVDRLAQMFKCNRFNVIRCEYTDKENVHLQRKFMQIADPVILAASQEHIFGLNATKDKLLTRTKKAKGKLLKHFHNITSPKKFSVKLLGEPFVVLFYAIKYVVTYIVESGKYNR